VVRRTVIEIAARGWSELKRSTDRILTTHIGSLPRPSKLLAVASTKAGNPEGYTATLSAAVSEVVRRQVEAGLDIIDDGEFGKPGFIHYINERLDGFEPGTVGGNPFAGSREHIAFAEFYQ
jgi:5-methyltetrahydropteroyltriglutamate--homocysteine methyltransferase